MTNSKTPLGPWRLYAIWWRDAFDGDNGWTDIERYEPTDTTVVTVGYLWPDCLENYYTLVNSYMPDEVPDMKTTSGPVHIPTAMVLRMVELTLPDFGPAFDEAFQKHETPSSGHPQTQGKFRNVSNRLRELLK